MARRESTILGMLGDLRLLLDALTASGEELPHLESWRARLEGLLSQATQPPGGKRPPPRRSRRPPAISRPW